MNIQSWPFESKMSEQNLSLFLLTTLYEQSIPNSLKWAYLARYDFLFLVNRFSSVLNK